MDRWQHLFSPPLLMNDIPMCSIFLVVLQILIILVVTLSHPPPIQESRGTGQYRVVCDRKNLKSFFVFIKQKPLGFRTTTSNNSCRISPTVVVVAPG